MVDDLPWLEDLHEKKREGAWFEACSKGLSIILFELALRGRKVR